jgi:hypothetical protein
MKKLKIAAEKRLGASLSKKARGHTVCWKLLNRLRSPSTLVAIDAETLIAHFESIFFDKSEPLFFDLPALGIPCPIDFVADQFTDADLVQALKDLNAQAAVGPQRISSSCIKSTFDHSDARVPLLYLMNRCMFEGRVPMDWAVSEVFVLYKGKGDKTLPSNYRGINLNNDFLRLFERLLDKKFSQWLDEHQPWGNQQFGFCTGVGTEDAATCLQTLAGICTRVKGFPLFANFVDLQRAFPSMLRSQILKILHEIGVPYGLIRAFAATFSGNSCRLKIDNKLTRSFPVNRGTKEGGINSPKIFNTVYATALKRLDIVGFPEEVSLIDKNAVYYLVFADDLVLLSGNLERLELVSGQLSAVLGPLGMSVNSAKTKWLAFLPDQVDTRTSVVSDIPRRFSLQMQGVFLENVESFRYLGFDMVWNLSKNLHQQRREDLQALAARTMGRLMRQLEVTNFVSLRAYYMALVRSQLYSLSFSTFSEEEYDRAQKIFLQNAFSLPSSYPIKVACFLLDIPSFASSVFDARSKFIRRIAGTGSLASLSALILDREELLPLSIGWNWELIDCMSKYESLEEVDWLDADEVASVRGKVQSSWLVVRDRELGASASGFLLDFFPSNRIPRDFAMFLGFLPHESVRIILIFFANLFQFTYLRSTKCKCPFCSGQLGSLHFFLCLHTPAPYNDWQSLIRDFQERKYWEALDKIFLVLQRWVSISNKFTPGFGAKVEEYFKCTENHPDRSKPRANQPHLRWI